MNSLEQQLIRHEGLKLKPYLCPAGKMTIGVGRNLEDTGITEAEAMVMLRGDIARITQDLAKRLPWFLGLDAARQQVLINMAFNLGVNGLLQFSRTLRHVEVGAYRLAAQEMLASKWAAQVRGRATELAKQMELGA